LEIVEPPSLQPTRQNTGADQRPLVEQLSDIHFGELADVGGKALNLAELLRAGYRVPPGFCVTTSAYQRVTDHPVLGQRLDDLAATPADDAPLLTRLAEEVGRLVLDSPVPDDIATAVVAAYRQMGQGVPVAVRSSATAEDLPFASFAGQQDTFLGIVGETGVLEAVRRCWASLWTPRAVTYRAAQGLTPHSVRLAVVVQQMVDAEVAGVVFTADPVTGRRRHTVIDASPGLGEAVVSGAVNPDHFVVDADTGAVLERRLGDKRMVVRPRPEGGTVRSEVLPGDDRTCLTDRQLRELTALGDRLERHFGSPQDIEWAVDGDGTLWLTQTRPITTLYPLPLTAPPPAADRRVYFCLSLAQGLNRPITPMGLASFRLLGSSIAAVLGSPVPDRRAGPPMYADPGQRLFVDLTEILRSRVGRSLVPKVLDQMEARSAVILRNLLTAPDLTLTRRSRLPFLGRALRVAAAYGVPLQVVRAVVSPRATHLRLLRLQEAHRRRLTPPSGPSPHQRLDWAEQLLGHDVVPLLPRIVPVVATGLAMLALAIRLLGADATRAEAAIVLRGLPHNVTTEMDLALWRLARSVQADADADTATSVRDTPAEQLAGQFRAGELPMTLQDGVRAFLRRYGHRSVAEIDLGVPRWADDPTYVFGILKNYLRLNDPALSPDAVFVRGAEEAEEMVDALTARAWQRSRARSLVVGFALRRTRQLAGVRELPKACMVRALAAARAEIAAVGADLASSGRLDSAEDVFLLDLTETHRALDGADLRLLVARRRETHAQELRRRRVPRVLLSDGTQPEASEPFSADRGGRLLRGTPASTGTVTGAARVVLDPAGARLDPGELLVAPSTDPGWTPLFLTAGGLVMEMGGANSHGAVVAREYGIPAVVGVPNATDLVSTGDTITIDGAAGVVTIGTD
jgi:phosphohistidine swiveling domain-containing protein